MTTSSSTGVTTPNPFSGTGSSSQAVSSGSATGSFDQQLSQALSESLQRLGVAPGEINISIKNGTDALSSRQIVITYNAAASSAPASSTGSGTAAVSGNPNNGAVSSTPNPFSGINSTPTAPAATWPAQVLSTDWSPWDGPRDKHDAIPAGGGQVTASGAPLIQANSTPVSNQYNYMGPAATNPYFTTPSNPLRDGYVLGFGNWFQEAQILGGKNGAVAANKDLYSTEEGAKEALRLAQQYAPDAQIVQRTWAGGPFTANKPMYLIQLGEGRFLNAGGLLSSYYYGGRGVTAMSDADLQRAIQMA